MKILAAFEVTGRIRDAFAERGHDAWSCDIQPCKGNHINGDAIEALYSDNWDLVIACPPCTHLASSGARWFKEKRKDGRQQNGIDLFMSTIKACDRQAKAWAVENPIGIMSSIYRKPDQIIQPWQFGHGETKATCLWLHNLPKLQPTKIVKSRKPRIHHMPPSKDRAQNRSETYTGIAYAMATQWSKI